MSEGGDSDSSQLRDRLIKARLWARRVGRKALEAQQSVEATVKAENEGLVTEVDRSVERELRENISESFPDDSIVGEEFPPDYSNGTSFTWFIDPIDGTASYSMALPIWTICLGLARENQPCAGVMVAPAISEEYYSLSGRPRKNGRKLNPDPVPPSSWNRESLLCVRSDTHRKYDVDFVGKCRSLGSSAYHMGLVIDGRAVGALLGRLHIWDVAAAWGIARSTPFVLETLRGQPPEWDHLVESNPTREGLIFASRDVTEKIRGRTIKKLSG